MHSVLVYISVKEEYIDKFIVATNENARNSRNEAGVIRFDIRQSADHPSEFLLIEEYKTPEDQILHRETSHYLKWKDTVAEMMAGPRKGVIYKSIEEVY